VWLNKNPHIAIGDGPSIIDIDFDRNLVYVANKFDGTISVIDGENNKKIGDDIKVGNGPTAIAVEDLYDKTEEYMLPISKIRRSR
jgi:YVTN family beta-propeller protein